jgi:hypothetical protein
MRLKDYWGANGSRSGLLVLAAALSGCVANSSNPSVAIRSAQSDERGALVDLEFGNGGGRNLIVTEMSYQVSHGESLFPVAQGTWSGSLDLPAHGQARLSLPITFDTPPIEADSSLLHLSGELTFTDQTGFLGMKSMDLTRTSFHADTKAERRTP